ncbi:MAG: hypothetical protein JWR77_2408 [Rhizorhabdus sp.]|nr:hypothetical protein [Rhizorhabdus sp.]
MPRNFLILLATTSLFAPAGAQSQALGERPIKRAEVMTGVKSQFAEMDRNHDGAVSPAEFAAYRAKQAAQPDGGAGLFRVGSHWFERTDTNGDGRVTIAEAQVRPLQMFDMADANRDGTASVDEQSMAMMLMKLGR